MDIEYLYNTIHEGDCLEIITQIPDESIDFFITDPPYGTNDNKGKVIRRGKSDTSFCDIEWDKKLPLKYISEVCRVMKPDTWGVIFTDNMAITTIWAELEKNNLKPRNTFYWIKNNKAPTPRSNFKSCVETAIVFTKGRTNIKWRGGGNSNNFITLPFVCGGEKENHPTQKPVKLFHHLISLMSDEGDVILDTFAGSGTTAEACIKSNRKYILIEKEKQYCEIIKSRINESNSQSALLKFL